MKKKVIIVSHNMDLGGVEKSLLSMLQLFDYNSYDVDLFLFSHSGALMKFIPNKVKILPENTYYSHINKSLISCIKKRQMKIVFSKCVSRIKYKKFMFHNSNQISDAAINYLYSFSNRFAPVISEEEYDLAISFSDVHYAVIDKVKAKKKVCWIHTDYSVTHQDTDFCFNMWNSFDNIVAVSKDCKTAFELSYPTLADKVIVIENTLSKHYVENESKSFNVEKEDECISILSIGRFCVAKNFVNVPHILKGIRNYGINARWYLIGYGEQEEAIKKEIINSGMEETVVLLGKKENPYHYIKNCDVYIQPSIYEGKSVTVREAQMLGKPVIITDYPTAHSQLKDGYDGVIVPMDIEGCIQAIVNVLNNKELLNTITENIKKNDYTNKLELKKLYAIIN